MYNLYIRGRVEEVRGYWRRLHNEELYDLYFSPNFIRVIRSSRLRWAGHVARMGETRNEYRFWKGNVWEKDQWEDLRIDEGISVNGF